MGFSKGFEKTSGVLGMVAKPILGAGKAVVGKGLSGALRSSNKVSGGLFGTIDNLSEMARRTRKNVALADAAVMRT